MVDAINLYLKSQDPAMPQTIHLDDVKGIDNIIEKKVVTNPGDSSAFKEGQIISSRELRDENSSLRRNDKKIVEVRSADAAVSRPSLQGITRASLGTESFISAASFQETT